MKNSDLHRQVGGNHYLNMPIQPRVFIRKNKLGYYEGQAIRYICRHDKKNGREDIEKAIHYLEFILEEYDKNPQPPLGNVLAFPTINSLAGMKAA